MSADLYKVYGNTLLNRLDGIFQGATIEEIGCAAPACADDVAVASSKTDLLQSLVHTSADYGSMERFDFQLVKGLVVKTDPDTDDDNYVWILNGEPMPVVTESMHVGILRSANMEPSAMIEREYQKGQKDPIQSYDVWLSWSQRARSRDDNTSITNMFSSGSNLWNGSGDPKGKALRFTREVLQEVFETLIGSTSLQRLIQRFMFYQGQFQLRHLCTKGH